MLVVVWGTILGVLLSRLFQESGLSKPALVWKLKQLQYHHLIVSIYDIRVITSNPYKPLDVNQILFHFLSHFPLIKCSTGQLQKIPELGISIRGPEYRPTNILVLLL